MWSDLVPSSLLAWLDRRRAMRGLKDFDGAEAQYKKAAQIDWTAADGARLAVQVSVSYEEGAEYSLLDGPRRETMGEVPSPVPSDRQGRRGEAEGRRRW